MGQKTIPQSLRLDYLKNWNSNWVDNKINYSKLLFLDYSLRNFIKKLCKRHNLNINNIYIEKKINYLNIYIKIYNISKNDNQILSFLKTNIEITLQKYTKHLNLVLIPKVVIIPITLANLNIGYRFYKNFKKYKKYNPFYRMGVSYYSFINLSYVAFYTQSAELISTYLIKDLQKNPKHRQYLNNINKILKKQYQIYDNCLGYKIELKGRVNGAARSRKIAIQLGKVSLNTLKHNIKYDFKEILTPYGICSLKVWLFFKN